MLHALAVFLGAGFVAKVLVPVLIGWVAHRRKARWAHVACLCNTVMMTAALLTIDQFKHRGLTLYSVFFAVLMTWMASKAAESGVIGFRVVRDNEIRRALEVRSSSLP